MVDGALSFHSWVRRGLGNAINTSGLAQRTIAVVELTFNQEPGVTPLPAVANLELIGPGEIVGLDSSTIVRRWPQHEDFDAEFKSYALLEIDQADLLWRYSPEPSPATDTQLCPWLSLLVFETSEATLKESTPEQKLPVLEVNDVALLPAEADLWAFGHTQFAGQNLSETAIRDAVAGKPGLFTGRLMSPRLLQANKDYIACLVPAFERGRLVGLNRLSPDVTVAALARWNRLDTTNQPGFQLPVYYSWRFKTGSLANFEEAARLLRPLVLPKSIGRRDMDVETPGFGLPPASTGSLPVEGALLSVAAAEAEPPSWSEPERSAFIERLRQLVNSPEESDDPELVPPLYAQWYAAARRLLTPSPGGSNPAWFFDLNSDPRQRVAAALGTQVIQREQQALLASGWQQVGEAASINDQARVLQLARGLLGRVYIRHVTEASLQRFYFLTLRLHSYVKCGDTTVCSNLRGSAIPSGLFSAQWTRWTRPRGPIGALQGRQALQLSGYVSDLLSRLNQCERPAPEPPPPPLHDPTGPRDGLYCEHIEELIALGSTVLLFWGLEILWVVRNLIVSQNGNCWWIALKALRFAIWLIHIAIHPDRVRLVCKLRLRTLSAADILGGPRFPGLSVTSGSFLPSPFPLPPSASSPGSTETADIAAIRADLARVIGAIVPPARLSCRDPIEIDACKAELVTKLDPELTVGELYLERRRVEVDWDPVDRLEPLFLPPEYEKPMYKPLSEISIDWILPGLTDITRDRVGLAVTNQKFIEAYMAGLNHEMTRELLWNEFPTDQRGTYFRQFWDIAGHILADGSKLPPEQLRDIKPLRQWADDARLGGNSPRPRPSGDPNAEFVVLVVRAQLIQKYPNVIVYAQQRDALTERLGGDQTHPIFYALVAPDTAFYGFQMTIADVRANEQLYFVFQEQPGEPKFADQETPRDGAAPIYTSPSTFGAATAGAFAQSTFLEPFRLGISARRLLPPPPA